MITKVKDAYRKLSPKAKKHVNIVGICALVLLLGLFVWNKHQEKQQVVKEDEKVPDKAYTVDTKILEKKFHQDAKEEIARSGKMFEEVTRELAGIKEIMGKQMTELNDLRAEVSSADQKPPDGKGTPNDGLNLDPRNLPSVFNPYDEQRNTPAQVPGAVGKPITAAKEIPVEVLGEIQLVSLQGGGADADKKKDETKKGEVIDRIYLSPAWMDAVLLNGMYCPVAKEAQSSPVPTLISVSSSSFLPNRYRADTKDCYLLAGCIGDLPSERASCRLISLSCLSRTGQSVIDQEVKGYLVDSADGFSGLRGKIVAKLGSLLGRSLLAGFFGGAGEYLTSTTMTSMISPIGQTITTPDFDPESMARGAIGKGLSQATKELQSFYLRLADASLPCIEIGNAKKITAVISEGVELEIMDYKMNIEDECTDCEDGGIFSN